MKIPKKFPGLRTKGKRQNPVVKAFRHCGERGDATHMKMNRLKFILKNASPMAAGSWNGSNHLVSSWAVILRYPIFSAYHRICLPLT
jgi:hypothetical protein